MWNNMVTSLLLHGRIETTEAKAKELRMFADPVITWGISVHALVAKGDKATRKGGYTRILKTRVRKGDAAPMAFIELVGLSPAIAA